MRNRLYLLALLLLFTSCSKKLEISVFNNSEVDRTNEMVEICLCQLQNYKPTKIVILDNKGRQVPYQLLYKGGNEPQSLIFPVTIEAGKQMLFTVKEGTPEVFPTRTFARFIPERKDDMAWENDCIAFRMYGPALADEDPSNGVDVWLKRTSNMIINKWYKNDIAKKASYHRDNGEGLDCYKVDHTLGAGGIVPYSNDSLWIGRYFNRYKVLDNGPLRSSFILYYDKVRYGSRNLKAELLITLDAGSNLNEGVIRFTGDTTNIKLAAGVCLHDSIQSLSGSAEQGYIGYAENVFSQSDYPLVPAGRCYTGVVFPGKVLVTRRVAGHEVGICNYKMGETFKYYFGAGWNKHGFASDQDWFGYLLAKRTSLLEPLKVKILR